MKEDFLEERLIDRKIDGAFTQLQYSDGLVDFCSGDYLGFARKLLPGGWPAGSTGSRLLSGNSARAEALEQTIARFHDAAAALLFPSGQDAGQALLASVPQKGDTVLYDRLCQATLRDALRLSPANSYAYAHNDLNDLESRLQSEARARVFVYTESVFGMDGDTAPLDKIAAVCDRYGAYLLADETHALGVIGHHGEGLVQQFGVQQRCFARIYGFGEAAGAFGAAVAGSALLKEYLVNFSRSLALTTALPPAALAAIEAAYAAFPQALAERLQLARLIRQFRGSATGYYTESSQTPIQVVVIPGNGKIKKVAGWLRENGVQVQPVLYPVVQPGSERLRIVLHAYNTESELSALVSLLASAGSGFTQQPVK
ncbi:MAG: pyridoxal phosphate-dependent aminotransferase family protein [Flavihumibacter sp.]